MPSAGSLWGWRMLAPEPVASGLMPRSTMRASVAGVRIEDAKMPDESILLRPEQAASVTSASSDDERRRQIRARLSDGRLGSVESVSKSHRGTGQPCIVCYRPIEPTDVEREVAGSGVFFHTHETCYKPWREESVARRAATARALGREIARRSSL